MPFAIDEVLRTYRLMVVIRRFEERARNAYMQSKAGGYLHLYSGQEAVACGILSVRRQGDPVVDSYRDHGHFLACGGSAREAMAELYGRATGCSRGKGGSMHLFSRARGFYGGSGIVGAGIGIGAGLAFALKYRDQPHVSFCFFGDGAGQTGLFHESLNLASLWGLPAVFVLENNQYAMGTSVERSAAEPEFYRRAAAYRMHGERVDGMDLFAVRDVAERLVPEVRESRRPVLVEAVTYRYAGHGAADPGTYRTRDEVEQWRRKDPIGRVEQWLLTGEHASEEDVERIRSEAYAEVDDAVRFAEESPPAEPDALFEHVHA